ncbi:MAG: serine hydrolase [Bacteroidetes bacterium]|nr:serine hydrolase [Bacteroidota bacterium]
MRRRKNFLWVILVVIVPGLAVGIWYLWLAFPIISGYGAKNLCSAVYLQHRNAEEVIKEDLGEFPLSLGTYIVNTADSSVTGSVWGFATKKAIYRKGLGSTLINDFTEAQIRTEHFSIPDPPAIKRDTVLWPVGDKLQDTIPSAVDSVLLNTAIRNVFEDTLDGRASLTRAALVVYDGQIVAEKYASGFDKNTVMLGWSMSKSITSALVGILVKQGKLDINLPAPVPEWKNSDKQKITVKNLLQQTTGIDFSEVYSGPSAATNMLFKKGDMAAYTAGLPLINEPGTKFHYSSGNSNILSRIIRQMVGEKGYASFPYTELFYKTGMYNTVLEPDASGTYVGSSYSYATARDFARFGLLYLNNGKFGGKQILPDGWVKETTTSPAENELKNYGYQFWLNGWDKKDKAKREFPGVPTDMFYADGYGGQFIYIIPSRKLVVVRLGLHNIREGKFLREVIASIH